MIPLICAKEITTHTIKLITGATPHQKITVMKTITRNNIAEAIIETNYNSENQSALDRISNSIDQAWKEYGGKEGLPTDEFVKEWCYNEDFEADFGEEFEAHLVELFG